MLAAGSVQMCSYVVSSELPPLSTKLAPPLPPTFINAAGKKEYACVSMAAGEISMVASKGCILWAIYGDCYSMIARYYVFKRLTLL